jgi:hypothetical protein
MTAHHSLSAATLGTVAVLATLLTATGCRNAEHQASIELPALLTKEDDGDLEGTIAALEDFVRRVPETQRAQTARDELKFLYGLRELKVDKIDSEVAKIADAAAKLTAPPVAGSADPKAKTWARSELKAAPLTPPPEPLVPLDAGILDEKARAKLADLQALAVKVHLSCRGFYRRNAHYTSNADLLDVEYDRDRYGVTLIPYSRKKEDTGYQGYTAEVVDKVFRSTMVVTKEGKFDVRVRPEVFAKALLTEPR